MRLIDAGVLIELLQKEHLASIPVIDVIGRTPTVDAVKHGHWVFKRTSATQGHYECSECTHIDQRRPDYCSKCGAKMTK